MTATICLVRHGAHDHLGRILSGRMPDVPLSAEGRAQAAALGRHFAQRPVDRMQTSPVTRARETAAAIADGIEVSPALDEIDFGDWTGASFDSLAGDPEWQRWNEARASARVPGGESMADAQARAVSHVEAEGARGGIVAMVTHCDIIRAVVCHVLGLSLDRILSFAVDVASITTLEVGAWGGRLVRLNEVPA